MSRQRSITHVIYDMDGLLLDTERFYTAATRVICERYGKVFDWTLKARMMGRRSLDSARTLTEALELPLSPAEYLEARRGLLDELFPRAEPLPGALELTRRLAGRGVPQAVASSSDRRTFDLKTGRHRGWFELFACIVLGDDPAIREGKPAPDIFLVAAERLEADPARCLVFEDSPAGVTAARAAVMAVIAVPDPNMDRTAYGDADAVLSSLTDFDPRAWGIA
jgi:pseudouridine-5'-monophosphatase